jgi:hypothetical protein
MAQRRPGRVGEQVLLRDVGHILGVGVLGEQMIEGLLFLRPDLLGDRLPPFIGGIEDRIDIENDAAERVNAVAHDLAKLELGQSHVPTLTPGARDLRWTHRGRIANPVSLCQ